VVTNPASTSRPLRVCETTGPSEGGGFAPGPAAHLDHPKAIRSNTKNKRPVTFINFRFPPSCQIQTSHLKLYQALFLHRQCLVLNSSLSCRLPGLRFIRMAVS
jgi:hypothetical protein